MLFKELPVRKRAPGRVTLLLPLDLDSLKLTLVSKHPYKLDKRYLNKILIVCFPDPDVLLPVVMIPYYQGMDILGNELTYQIAGGFVHVISNLVVPF